MFLYKAFQKKWYYTFEDAAREAITRRINSMGRRGEDKVEFIEFLDTLNIVPQAEPSWDFMRNIGEAMDKTFGFLWCSVRIAGGQLNKLTLKRKLELGIGLLGANWFDTRIEIYVLTRCRRAIGEHLSE